MAMTVIVTIIAAYLIGSINFAVIFAKAFMKKDVRELGSGNAGATNVMRNAGILPGGLTFICDALKGFVACYMGRVIFDYIFEQTGADLAALCAQIAQLPGHFRVRFSSIELPTVTDGVILFGPSVTME